MSSKPDPQTLLNELIGATDLTPDKVRQIVDNALPVPPASSAASTRVPDIAYDTAINYFKLNRK